MHIGIRTTFVLLIFAIISIPSCYLDDTSPNPQFDLPYQNISSLFDTLRPAIQVFEIDASSDAVIDGKEGTELIFPAGSFTDCSGDVIDETILVSLRELYASGDLMFNNLPATSSGQLMETGGILYLQALKDGKKLCLDKEIQANLTPNNDIADKEDMEVFYADDNSLSGDNPEVWEAVSDGSKVELDSDDDLQLLFNQLGWVNSGYLFETDDPNTTVVASSNAKSSLFNDGIGFIVYPDLNGIMRMSFENGNYTADEVPTEKDAEFVLIGMTNAELFFGKKQIKVTSDLDLNVEMQPVSESELRLSLLDFK